MKRGEVWWYDFGEPRGSAPALRRPVLIVSSDRFNNSGIATVQVVSITGNTRLAAMPGTVFLPGGSAGLREDAVVLAHQISTVDRSDLEQPAGGAERIGFLMKAVDAAVRLVLDI